MVLSQEDDDIEIEQEEVGTDSYHRRHHHQHDDETEDPLGQAHLDYHQETQHDPLSHCDPYSRHLAGIASGALAYLASMESRDPNQGLIQDM